MNKKSKKIKIPKKNNFINLFWLVIISVVIILAIITLKEINLLNLENSKENSKTENQEKGKKIPKKENITVLVTGRWGAENDAPDLTDTIMLLKLNSTKKTVSILSIPRDLYVKFPDYWEGKINSLYSTYYYRERDKDYAMNVLKQKITQITWEKIDYYINLDFAWFRKTINTLWWIEVDVQKKLVDTKYPNSNWWYQTVIFRKWKQVLNWERALMYARSRKSTSDYDRSLRQQQVIKAIKEKVASKYVLKSPEKIAEIYNIFKENVFTDINLKDTISIVLSTDILNWDYKFISSNMNDTCYYWALVCEKWWIVYNPKIEVFWSSVELFNWTDKRNLSDYELAQKYSNIVLNYPNIEEEKYKINIFNSTKRNWLAYKMSYNIKRYWFYIPKENYAGNTEKPYEKSVIYYNNVDKNSDTIKWLKEFFDWDFIETEEPMYSTDAKIEIILWKNYLIEKDVFKF